MSVVIIVSLIFSFPCHSYAINCTIAFPQVVFQFVRWVFRVIIELSVCYETRTEEARNFKKRRYQNLKSDLSIEWEKLNIIYVEIATLGFVSRNIKDFAEFVKPLGISYERMIGKCMETALRASFYIFTCQDKEWPNPELLHFY